MLHIIITAPPKNISPQDVAKDLVGKSFAVFRDTENGKGVLVRDVADALEVNHPRASHLLRCMVKQSDSERRNLIQYFKKDCYQTIV